MPFFFFFQATSGAAPAANDPVSLLDILLQGGWVMVPLLLLSGAALYLFVERLMAVRRAEGDPEAATGRIRRDVRAGRIEEALQFCREEDTPITRILRQGLERLGRPISEIQDAVQAAGKHEAFALEKRTDLLASIASVAPLLGFFGTVMGMIEAFRQVQTLQSNADPSVLAGGIWEALVTTATGLAVGIFALLAYNYLLGRIKRLINDMERSATAFIDLLQEPVAPGGNAAPAEATSRDTPSSPSREHEPARTR
jgi:biopolymer transport protein ExbB